MALFNPEPYKVPVAIKAKSTEGLERKIMQLQFKLATDLTFVTMYYDSGKQEHVAWYYIFKKETDLILGDKNAKITE